MNSIEYLARQLDSQLAERRSRHPEVKEFAIRRLRENRGLIELVSRDGGYQDFLLSYIQEEREKYNSRLKHPEGETRDRPLCTCSWDCELKTGDEPAEFEQYDSIDEAIRAFKRAHDGRPVVLDEAREAWGEQVGEVETLYRRLCNALTNNEIPRWGADDDLRELLARRRRAEAAEESDGGGSAVEAD